MPLLASCYLQKAEGISDTQYHLHDPPVKTCVIGVSSHDLSTAVLGLNLHFWCAKWKPQNLNTLLKKKNNQLLDLDCSSHWVDALGSPASTSREGASRLLVRAQHCKPLPHGHLPFWSGEDMQKGVIKQALPSHASDITGKRKTH